MKIEKNKLALTYRIIIIIISFIALYLNFKFLSIKTGIVYFTYLSNIACFLYYTLLVAKTIVHKNKEDKYHYILKGMIIMSLTLTMAVYNFVLSKDNQIYNGHQLECILVHLIIPLLVIFDYILFGKKGNLKKTYPFIWIMAPLVYQVFITVYSLLGGKFIDNADFPYLYMDTSIFGKIGVFRNYILIAVVFIVYGQIIVLIDNYLGNKK